MIIVRAPLRIPIGGGGTDLPFFYPKFGGELITGAIDKYIYVTVNKRKFTNEHRIAYSKTENVDSIDKIENTRVREALKLLDIKDTIEITTISELPSKSGLGGSSVFLVALLKALHAYKGESVSNKILAEEAAKIEIDILNEPIGKQDQYASSFGGINCLSINKTGSVSVSPLNISESIIRGIEGNTYMFYTGIQRNASEVIADQSKKALNDEEKMNQMNIIKEIGLEIKKALEQGEIKRFGQWLNVHWETKKKMSEKMSNPEINRIYEVAIKNGALGGKIMGAGGGGFFLFYNEKNGSNFIEALEKEGLKYVPFKFDFDGCKIMASF